MEQIMRDSKTISGLDKPPVFDFATPTAINRPEKQVSFIKIHEPLPTPEKVIKTAENA